MNPIALGLRDDDNIQANDVIIRRINPAQHVIRDKNRNLRRISTKAFQKSSGKNEGMSVDIEALILKDGKDPREFVTTPDYPCSVYFYAGDVRELGLLVGPDPVENVPGKPDNPYHGQVWPEKPTQKFTRKQQKGLLKAASWYVQEEGVELLA